MAVTGKVAMVAVVDGIKVATAVPKVVVMAVVKVAMAMMEVRITIYSRTNSKTQTILEINFFKSIFFHLYDFSFS